jgi:Ca-activated chloride channel family protein
MQISRRQILATLALASSAIAQTVTIEPRKKRAPKKSTPDTPSATLRADTNLVLIPVTVGDPLNRPVLGLEKGNFRLLDDKVPQIITQFAMEDAPVAVGLVFDTSGSMGTTLRRSRLAAMEFFKTANPEDEFALVEFDNHPRLSVPLTADTAKIENQLLFSKSKGSTALLDAVLLALHEMKKSKIPKKALMIISDGGDNHSRYTVSEVNNIIRESDVLIYSVGIFSSFGSPEEIGGPRLLANIAEQTGGRAFAADPRELPDIAAKIGIDLRNRYVLGYACKNQQRDGRYHHVQVQILPPPGLPKLTAIWRTGYYAPAE